MARSQRRALLGSTALAGLLAVVLQAGPASAGGSGGDNGGWPDGTPGTGGTPGVSIGQGGAGGNGTGAGGVGGGLGNSSSGAVTNSTTVAGGAGGNGGNAPTYGNGGGGGGGGDGWSVSGGVLTNIYNITGGAGGAGGNGMSEGSGPTYRTAGSGSGGGGGAGLVGTGGSIINRGSITGGNGGDGGSYTDAGASGGGGAGISGSGLTITNGGTISGGNGGVGRSGSDITTHGGAGSGGAAGGVGGIPASGSYAGAAAGAGGAGIIGSNLTVTNGGQINAGAAGAGRSGAGANAITFTGGANVLELWGGSAINGNVVDQTGNGTFRLGGLRTGAFDVSAIGAQYQGFASFEVNGGTWTLTGTHMAMPGWRLFGGSLAISQDGSLGAATAGLTMSGGALITTASFTTNRAITLGGAATFMPDAGTTLTAAGVISNATGVSGGLIMSGDGTLNLTAANTYTGMTWIDGGTLMLSGAGSIASSELVFVNAILDISQTAAGASIRSLLNVDTAGIVALGNKTLTLTNANDPFYGTITGTGGLRLAGGIETLGGVNTYSGVTEIDRGAILVIADTGSIASSSRVIANGQLDISATWQTSVNSLDGSGSVWLGNATLTLTNASGMFSGNIDGPGGVALSGGTEILASANSYTGGTSVTGGTLIVGNDRALGAGAVTMAQGATLGFLGNRAVANAFALTGVANFNVDGHQTAVLSGVIGDGASAGGFAKTGAGTLILTGHNTYTGDTFINGGTLQVDGSIGSSSNVVVGAGATLSGIGLVDPPHATTIASGATLSPGNAANPLGTLSISGNLALASAATYAISLDATKSSITYVSGQAAPGGATVSASFIGGSSVAKRYTILTADGGVSGSFNGAVNATLPTNFKASTSYDPTHAYLTLALDVGPNATRNQRSVGAVLSNYFDRNGSIPLAWGAMSPASLSQIAGETATGAQQTTFNAMNLFMGTMADPSAAGRGQGACGAADLPVKAPRGAGCAQPWSVWASGFGGSQTTDGNAVTGSSAATGNVYGTAVGADYRISPNTAAGFALGGGGTNFSVKGMGAGRSDLFQAGAYVRHDNGPAYVTAAVAAGWQDVTMDRTVAITGVDRLHAAFSALAYSGRVESGYRFVAPVAGGVGLTPYAAAQVTAFDLPGYAESVTAGAGTFALAYAAKTATDTRSELGVRADKSFALPDGLLNLRGRFAWAHDFSPERSVMASLQGLSAVGFVVNGAAQASDAALITASVEKVWRNGWSAAATFEGEFSNVTRSYAGKGVVRYGW
ncbi:MAG: autotransporter domain-containing protein [Pseudomonadota bacterium]